MKKQIYNKPEVEVFEFKIEQGFVGSGVIDDNNTIITQSVFIGDLSMGTESVNQGLDYMIYDNNTWF